MMKPSIAALISIRRGSKLIKYIFSMRGARFRILGEGGGEGQRGANFSLAVN